jgi:hypothetical protein
LLAFVTRLSRVVIACMLVLLAVDSAMAQSITVNGSSGAVAINRGDTIAVTAGGGSAARDCQRVTFTLLGAAGLAQPPFSVDSVRFDSSNQVFSVMTVPGHPLFGWRYWKVMQLAPGKIRVETGAVDRPAPGTQIPFWLSRNEQTKTWLEYMQRIRDVLGASQDLSRTRAIQIMHGVWDYDKTYIMTQVCGSAPILGTWVCQ